MQCIEISIHRALCVLVCYVWDVLTYKVTKIQSNFIDYHIDQNGATLHIYKNALFKPKKKIF